MYDVIVKNSCLNVVHILIWQYTYTYLHKYFVTNIFVIVTQLISFDNSKQLNCLNKIIYCFESDVFFVLNQTIILSYKDIIIFLNITVPSFEFYCIRIE